MLRITDSEGVEKMVPCVHHGEYALLNLTDHSVVVGDIEIPPSGEVARVQTGYVDDQSYGVSFIAKETPGEINGLPRAIPADTFVICSAILWEQLRRERHPGCSRVVFVKPATGHPLVVRNGQGQIVSVPRLIAINWGQE